jgi:hypothetical protein
MHGTRNAERSVKTVAGSLDERAEVTHAQVITVPVISAVNAPRSGTERLAIEPWETDGAPWVCGE